MLLRILLPSILFAIQKCGHNVGELPGEEIGNGNAIRTIQDQ